MCQLMRNGVLPNLTYAPNFNFSYIEIINPCLFESRDFLNITYIFNPMRDKRK